MKLTDLERYNNITIQCHDNPDADAIASAFGLYKYYTSKNKHVRIIYSGHNPIQKANLKLLIDRIEIPIEFIPDCDWHVEGLLITVDCQYGQGNVSKIPADAVAVIDHHQIEIEGNDMVEIQSYLGSCSTLVWKMLTEAGYDIEHDKKLGTALYYGLMTDTNSFAELYHPLDRDLQDEIICDKTLINLFCNSNLSLKELEIAGIALIRYIYNEKYRYAIIHAQPCDPNILGLISDLVLQVDAIDVCAVYNEMPDGFKLSVRSCVKEVRASELAVYLTKDIGAGGGHVDKAGGFIGKRKYDKAYPKVHSEAFFGMRLTEYFASSVVIYAQTYDLDMTGMKMYKKKRLLLGFADPLDFLEKGTPVTIRTLEGDVEVKADGTFYVMIGLKGEVYPIDKEKFLKTYDILKETYDFDAEYQPTIRNCIDGAAWDLVKYAKTCRARGVSYIYARELDVCVKIFTKWDEEKYMMGKPGDFIACRNDDRQDIYVVERDIFFKTYEEVEEIAKE